MNDTGKDLRNKHHGKGRKWAAGIGLAAGAAGLIAASYEVFCPRATFLGKVAVRGPASTQAVALVFHKMPDQFTEDICRTLHELEIQGSFFIVGERVAAMPHAAKAMRPFEIGVHAEAYTPLVFKSAATIRALVYLAAERASQIQNRRAEFIMPPFGWKGTGLLTAASSLGMRVVNPTRRIRLAQGGPIALNSIDRILDRVLPGDILLVSLGIGLNRQEIPDLLGYLVEGLREKGLTPWGLKALLHF